ncbi:MAG: elongation factor P [Dehalococcoidia bacterium]|nr:elongation factor P [Dehalococcoidia bacterium]
MAIEIGEVHKNSKLLINGVPYNVEEYDFMKPGKGRAVYRLRLRNLLEDTSLDITYHSGDKVEEAHVTSTQMQYLYREGDHYVFMNTETFDQYMLGEKKVGNKKNFLKEGIAVTGVMMEDRPIDILLPNFVELAVIETAASSKTDTRTAQNKTSVLETGLTIGVPTFVNEGDIVKIDTRTGAYVERITQKK